MSQTHTPSSFALSWADSSAWASSWADLCPYPGLPLPFLLAPLFLEASKVLSAFPGHSGLKPCPLRVCLSLSVCLSPGLYSDIGVRHGETKMEIFSQHRVCALQIKYLNLSDIFGVQKASLYPSFHFSHSNCILCV